MERSIRRSRLVLTLLVLLSASSWARADGGEVRLSQRTGDYQVTVFTAPTPFRAGPVDVSVLVQDALTGEAVLDVPIQVQAAPHGRRGRTIAAAATTEAATNKLLHAALFDLPEAGWWDMEIRIDGPRGPAQVRCTLETAEPPPRWLTVWPWIAWPALVVLLYGIHQGLARRSEEAQETRAVSKISTHSR